MTAQIIDTPDFTLRPFRAADASAVASKIANWDVIRMLTTPPHPYRRQDAVNHIARVQNDDWHWVIDIGGPAGSIAIGKHLGRRGRGWSSTSSPTACRRACRISPT
ncbi:MAG: hypothetical protein AAGI22_25685 [Planctomycetota bacterium]